MTKELAIKGLLSEAFVEEAEVVEETVVESTELIKVGLDIGASRVKLSFMKNSEIVDISFPNRIDKKVTASGTEVELKDEKVKVGTISGYSNSVNKKINYRYLPQILFTVAHKVKQELNIPGNTITLDINTVLPPQEFKESRDQYRDLIQKVNGTRCKVNGEYLTLKIKDVKVGAEGVALLNACNLDSIAKNLTQVLLLDVGSSTTDIVVLTKDGKWKIKDALTSRTAGRDMCKAIETELNAGTGCSFVWDELERQQIYELDGEARNIVEKIDATDDVISELIADLGNIGNIRQYKVILAGAGSRLLKESKAFQEYTKFSCISDDLLDFGNSRGALKA